MGLIIFFNNDHSLKYGTKDNTLKISAHDRFRKCTETLVKNPEFKKKLLTVGLIIFFNNDHSLKN